MANFGKFANLSPKNWTEKTATQIVPLGQSAHIGLWGGGPAGEDLVVQAENPSICVPHEEPRPKGFANWRHFLITALKDGETKVTATLASGAVWASMTVKVTGHSGLRLIFFPGERMNGSTLQGTIYVIGPGDTMPAAGGPPVRKYDKGGHTAEPTPPGNYVLGPRVHVTTSGWPTSVIPYGAALRINSDGEAEWEASPGKWKLASGPHGEVTKAKMAFLQKDKLHPKLADVGKTVRGYFINPKNGQLWDPIWEWNDFGRWGWNLLSNGQKTAYWVHTTPDDEHASEQAQAVFLVNSHGCIHLDPKERERLEKAGYLKQGVPFEVRPYSETGPP